MAINLKSLRKVESGPLSRRGLVRDANERVVVLVKLRSGAERPLYIPVRQILSGQFFSSEIPFGDLPLLEADPAVESVALSRTLPVIE
jgi:hypothetical protein